MVSSSALIKSGEKKKTSRKYKEVLQELGKFKHQSANRDFFFVVPLAFDPTGNLNWSLVSCKNSV